MTSYAQKMLKAIRELELPVIESEHHYERALRIRDALWEKTGFQILAMTDLNSTDARPIINICVWSPKGKLLKNPNLKNSDRYQYYFYVD